jgi:hypothetical protein
MPQTHLVTRPARRPSRFPPSFPLLSLGISFHSTLASLLKPFFCYVNIPLTSPLPTISPTLSIFGLRSHTSYTTL